MIGSSPNDDTSLIDRIVPNISLDGKLIEVPEDDRALVYTRWNSAIMDKFRPALLTITSREMLSFTWWMKSLTDIELMLPFGCRSHTPKSAPKSTSPKFHTLVLAFINLIDVRPEFKSGYYTRMAQEYKCEASVAAMYVNYRLRVAPFS